MQHFVTKAFSLNDIKYSWLLLISIIIFGVSFYLDLYFIPAFVQITALLGYGGAFILAALWGALNYIGHIRINALYQKNHDIFAFVDQLALDHEEKLELQAYLEDYVHDQINNGKTKEDAAKEAISQFKVKEFSALSKNTMLFNLHAHYYLIGFSFLAFLAFFILLLAHTSSSSLFLLAGAYTILAYGIGFAGLFFVYKVVDIILYKKLKDE
ncbi:hypothetical protein [Domibacillus robiginosus]|uniref:hypothetical protein n=1 Tax=Domibacillus robiginosus TaxID=1071054 RepID=UPI00067CBE7C|nr:hypothetical protein [Domibacillus robiginosus]